MGRECGIHDKYIEKIKKKQKTERFSLFYDEVVCAKQYSNANYISVLGQDSEKVLSPSL